ALRTKPGADPNPPAAGLVNSLVNGTAADEALSGVHASHDVPAARRSRSWNSRIGSDSQYPSGFHSLGGWSVLGASTPSRTISPVSADVPLRCMPRTSRARLTRH